MSLISNFTYKNTSFKWISGIAMDSSSQLNLKRASCASVLKKYVFDILEELIRKYPHRNTTSSNRMWYGWYDCTTRPKIWVWKSYIWRPGSRIYVFCMFILRLFYSGMKLGVKIFRNLIKFGPPDSLRFALILLYSISFRAWVEKPHIKNCIRSLMVIMSSYFYKGNENRS